MITSVVEGVVVTVVGGVVAWVVDVRGIVVVVGGAVVGGDAHVVGAQRVDRDEQDVRAARRRVDQRR